MRHEDRVHCVHVKRPHVDAFLHEVTQMFEFVVFTATISSYSNQLLNELDPMNRLTVCFFPRVMHLVRWKLSQGSNQY